ncbi:MAG: hypothetical protein L6Q54_11690 [Leptospiraceae bacterium]|nr:hypothetical protein [Leptospiraceae bacterium]
MDNKDGLNGIRAIVDETKKASNEFSNIRDRGIKSFEEISKTLDALRTRLTYTGDKIQNIKSLLAKQTPGSEQFNKLNAELQKLELSLIKDTQKFNSLNKELKEFNQESGKSAQKASGLSNALGGITALASGAALISIGKSVINTTATFEKYEAVLKIALGSQKAMEDSMKMIVDLASSTPFSVDELTMSYVKLVNRGLKPSQEEITKLGDIAASQGKSFDQLVEAVLDAGTGEMERLKEFGIQAKQAGDKVQFSFRGINTVVEKTPEAIKNAIVAMGAQNGVMGSMSAISETTGGKISNMGDAMDKLALAFGGIFKTQTKGALDLLIKLTEGTANLINNLSPLGKGIIVAGTAFTVLIVGMKSFISLAPLFGTSLAVSTGGLTALTSALAASVGMFYAAIDAKKRWVEEDTTKATHDLTRAFHGSVEEVEAFSVKMLEAQNNIKNGSPGASMEIANLRGELQNLGVAAEDAKKIVKTDWLGNISNDSMIQIQSVIDRMKKINSEQGKTDQKETAKLSVGKPDLSASKRYIDEYFKANPSFIDTIMRAPDLLPLEFIKKEIKEFNSKSDVKIKLRTDTADSLSAIDQIKTQLNKFQQSGVDVDINKIFDFKPEKISELSKHFGTLRANAEKELNSIKETFGNDINAISDSMKKIRAFELKAVIDSKSIDEFSEKLKYAANTSAKLSNQWRQSTGDLTEIERGFFETSETATRMTTALESNIPVSQKVGAVAKGIGSIMEGASKSILNAAQAFADFNSVLAQNKINKLQSQVAAIGQLNTNITNSQIEGIQSQQDAIEEERKAEERADKEHNARKLEEERQFQIELATLKAEFDSSAKAENEKKYQEALALLTADYEAKKEHLALNQSDEEQNKIAMQFLNNDFEEAKINLRATADQRLLDLTAANAEKIKQKEDAHKAKKEQEEIARQNARDAREAARDAKLEELEKQKEQKLKESEERKFLLEKLSAYRQWQIGKSVFEVNKKIQIANATVAMAMSILQAVAGVAMMAATGGVPGFLAGIGMLALVTTMSLVAGSLAIATAASQTYPAFQAFADGGIVTGGVQGKDSVPAMLTPGELVVPEKNFSDLKLGKTQNMNITIQNNFSPRDDSEKIINTIETRLVDRIKSSFNPQMGFA